MNKIHNIIWSTAQNAWVVVAEGTKRSSKSGAKSLKVMMALVMLSPTAGFCATLPQNGVISVGEGSIVNNGSNQLTIKQTTEKLGINWQTFNIGADGRVVFDQPGKNSVAMNRVIGSDSSVILGKIDANGQVFLINPNGVIFGKDAQVNVGGLVASTLNITDADFKNGQYRFQAGSTHGEVLNLGSLEATQGGYVALLGKSVKNQGIIKAKLGSAALAAGDTMTLDFSGDGLVNLQISKSTLNALAENKGLIKADGGSVLMSARASNALTQTVVNNEGIIEATTLDNRSGKIFLDGGFDSGTVHVAGTLDASAPNPGNGGFIETSGKSVTVSSAVKVTTLAKNGQTGDWLVDPTDFNIVAGSGGQTINSIGATTLSNNLESTNVTLSTDATATPGQMGDVNVNADVAWNANTKLTLNAHNNVNINAKIIINGNTGGLVLNPTGRVNTANGGAVKLNGASTTYTQNGVAYQVLRTVNDLNNLTSAAASNKKFVLGGDIDASIMSTWNGGKGFDGYGDYDSTNTTVSGTIFNGLGNTISNFYVNRPTETYVGLFGVFYNGTISNLNLSGTVIGAKDAGLLAGEVSNAKVYNVNTSGSVNGTTEVGGAIGMALQSTIDTVTSTADVTGTGQSVGGVLGYTWMNTAIKALRYSGHVVGDTYTGGVIGKSYVDTLVTDLATTGSTTVTGNAYVGGGVGHLSPGGVANNISTTGTVIGNTSVGGVFGYVRGNLSNLKTDAAVSGTDMVGGLVGELTTSTLDSAFATGNVTATGSSVGGLVGKSNGSTITKALSTGNVIGTQDVGGLVGISSSDTLKNSFSTSKVTGSQNVGGFTGNFVQSIVQDAYATGEVSADTANSGGFSGKSYFTNYKYTYASGKNSSISATGKGGFVGVITSDVFTSSFWDTQKSGMATSAGAAVGKTTAQLQTASTFVGWGLSTTGAADANVWRIYEGNSSPLLKFVMGTANVQQQNLSSTYTGYAQTPTYTPGMSSLTNVASNGFFASLLNLTSSGLMGGDYFGPTPMKNAGVYTITNALYSGQFGLNLIQDNVGTFTIDRAVLGFSGLGDNKVYDGTTGATASLTANGLGSDVLTVTGYNASFDDKNVGTGKVININGITVSGAAASNYTWGTVSTTGDIAKANLTITASGAGKTYDGTTSASASLADNRIGGDDLTISKNAAFADKNAGTAKLINVTGINVTGSDAGNYVWNTTAVTVADIAKAALSVSATGVNKTYDALTGATVTFTDDRLGSDVLVVGAGAKSFSDKNAETGKTVAVTGITVTGADAVNYTWNSTASTTADIAKAALNVSATGANKTYDGSTTAIATLADNRMGSDSLVVSAGTKAFSDKNAGAGKTINVAGITVTGTDADNYTWNTTAATSADIYKAALTVTASGLNKVYDGTTSALATLTDNRIGADDLVLSSSGNVFADKNAGMGKAVTVNGINVTGTDADNYTWNTSASTTADVAKAALNITATGINKTYDSTTTAGVSFADNRLALDDLAISSTVSSFADKNAGGGKAITVNGLNVTGSDAGNYIWNTSATTSADIAKALLNVTAIGVNKTYDATTNANATLSDDRIGADSLVLSASSKNFADKNAGTAKAISVSGINVTGSDAGNYTWNNTAATTADIAKAALTVTASGINKTYDATTHADVNLSDNRIGSDVLLVTADNKNFADKNAGAAKAINVSDIQVAGADAGNYSWNLSTVTSANIAKAALTIRATGVNKTYDGTTKAGAILSDDHIGADQLLVGATNTAFVDKNAGVGKVISISGITVSGADAGNYTWNTAASTSATINKALLNVIANAQDKAYDGSALAQVNFMDNRVIGDQLVVTSAVNTFDDKNVGVQKDVSVSGISISGADSGNYTWNTAALSKADVTKAYLVIKAENGSKVEGAADGSLAWSVQSGQLFGSDGINGDLARDSGEAEGLYAIGQGNLSAGSNYSLSVVPGTFEITKAVKPPIVDPIIPPVVVTPPVVITPPVVVSPPVVVDPSTPPVVVTPKPPVVIPPVIAPSTPEVNVELEQARNVISTISVATKVSAQSLMAVTSDTKSVIADYRLINLGIKLPEENGLDE
jgi:filamentous hemagglutinin family protein